MKTPENAVFSRVLRGDPSGIRTLDTLIKSQVLVAFITCKNTVFTGVFGFLEVWKFYKKVAQKLHESCTKLFIEHLGNLGDGLVHLAF